MFCVFFLDDYSSQKSEIVHLKFLEYSISSLRKCIKSHHAQIFYVAGLKSSFHMKLYFAFYLEIKILASEHSVERNRYKGHLLVAGLPCFFKSKINVDVCQRILKHFLLPSASKLYGDASFL